MTMITGEANVRVASMLATASAMALELNTGMKMSRGFNVWQVAFRNGYTTKARKHRDRLVEMVAAIQAVYPEYQPQPTVVRAMAKPVA